MINVRIIRRAKSQTGTGAGTAYSGGTAVIAGTVDEAKHAYVADRAGSAEYADKSGYADTAGTATRAHTADNLADDFEYPDRWIRNDESDTASGDLYTFKHDVTVTEDTVHGGTTTHNGQTTHNARAVFKQHFDLPNESVGRIAGTLHFANTIEQAGTAQPNGSISGTGIAQMKKMTLTGPDTAGQYDTLDVTGTSIMRDIIGPYSGSVRFEDGFTGHGFRIWKDENNAYHVTTDYLTVRQQMKVFELLIQKIRSTAGSIVVSDANGKIKRVEEMTIASENDTWLIWFETDHDFAPGDIMRVQSWKGLGTSAGSYENTSWWGVVGAVRVLDGEKVVLMSKSTWSGSVPKEGDEVVQWGNTGVTTGRDKILYLTAAENDRIGISMYEDVNTINGGHLTLKIGDLSGINDNVFGQLSGWGLYAQSVYLRSDNIAGSDGKTISQRFQVAEGKLESVISGTRALTKGDSIVSNYDFEDGDTFPDGWGVVGVDGTALSDGTSLLSDGQELIAGYGGTNYVVCIHEDPLTYIRIIDDVSDEFTAGFRQDVNIMRQDLWTPGSQHDAKTVEMRFRYRMKPGSSLSVEFYSTYGKTTVMCDTDRNHEVYGLKTPLRADNKWHDCIYYGEYIGGSGYLTVYGLGQVDVTHIECRTADSVAYTTTKIAQTDEEITAMAEMVTAQGNEITKAQSAITVNAESITALSGRMSTAEGRVTTLEQAGFVTSSQMAGQVSSVINDPQVASVLQETYATNEGLSGELAKYVLNTAYQSAMESIQHNFADVNTALGQRPTEQAVRGLITEGTSGFVNSGSLASMFSGYWTYWKYTDEGASTFFPNYDHDSEGYVVDSNGKRQLKYNVSASISTFNFVEYETSGGEKVIKGGIKMQADQILQLANKIQAVVSQMSITADTIEIHDPATNEKTLWINGNGNVTMRGVLLNLIQSIDSSSNLIISNSEEAGGENCNPEATDWPTQGSDFDSLDFLMMGDTIKMTNDKGHGFIVPFYIANVNQGGNECYARTWTRYGGTLHKITTDELLMFVGRRYNIIMSQYNTASTDGDRYLHAPELIEVSDGSVTSPNGVSTIEYRGIKLGVQQVISLEFRMGRFRYSAGGNYNYSPCFYFKIIDTAGQLPNWT